jgi:hypothetical protein
VSLVGCGHVAGGVLLKLCCIFLCGAVFVWWWKRAVGAVGVEGVVGAQGGLEQALQNTRLLRCAVGWDADKVGGAEAVKSFPLRPERVEGIGRLTVVQNELKQQSSIRTRTYFSTHITRDNVAQQSLPGRAKGAELVSGEGGATDVGDLGGCVASPSSGGAGVSSSSSSPDSSFLLFWLAMRTELARCTPHVRGHKMGRKA